MLVHFIRFLRHCQFVRVSLGRYLTEMFVGLIGHSVYETYYLQNFLKDRSSADIAWIGSIQTFTQFSATLLVGPINDRYGPMVCLFRLLLS